MCACARLPCQPTLGLSYTDPEPDKQMDEKKVGWMDGWQKNKRQEKRQEVLKSKGAVTDRSQRKVKKGEKGGERGCVNLCVGEGVRKFGTIYRIHPTM